MLECPRCHYQTQYRGNLKNHFHKKNICLPIYDNTYQKILQTKVLERNAFKVDKKEKEEIESNITKKEIILNENESKKKEYRCKYCNKNYSNNSHMNRHIKTCKIRIQKEKDDEDIKNKMIKNFKEQVLLLQKHIYKLENDNNILKLKNDNLKIENLNNNENKNFNDNLKNDNLKNENENKNLNENKNKSKSQKIPSTLRHKIWVSHNGKVYESNCYCCSKEINITNFHCGHIISRKDNGPTNEDNLRPICSDCNSSMGSQNMETFKNVFFS